MITEKSIRETFLNNFYWPVSQEEPPCCIPQILVFILSRPIYSKWLTTRKNVHLEEILKAQR